MKTKTTLIVGVLALAVTLAASISSSPASTPMVRSTYQGRSAEAWARAAHGWQQTAARRARTSDWLQKRLTLRVLQVRDLRRVKAAPVKDVQYAIRLAATTYGVSETDMHRVASCESGHSSTAVNGRYRGVYQEGPMFERGRYGRAGFSVWDPVANAMTAAETVAHEGWSQWSCKP